MKTFFMSLVLAALALSATPSYSQTCYDPTKGLQVLTMLHMTQTWSGHSDHGYTVTIYTDEKTGEWLIFADMTQDSNPVKCMIDSGKKS